MDNMEENSRSTEQDRVANPVEETVSTTVEPALSENKRERKKREKAEKKKNAPAQGNSLLGSTLAKIMAFVLMIAAAIAGVLGLYGTCMLADSGAYSSGKMMFIHDQLLYRQVNQDLYRIRDWYENESLQTMEAYCRQRNIWVKVESYDLDTDEFLGEWKNEDYVDKTNDLTYRLESQVQHRNDNTYINTETSSVSDSYESYGSSDIMELEPSVNTGSEVESITAAEQEALSSGNHQIRKNVLLIFFSKFIICFDQTDYIFPRLQRSQVQKILSVNSKFFFDRLNTSFFLIFFFINPTGNNIYFPFLYIVIFYQFTFRKCRVYCNCICPF